MSEPSPYIADEPERTSWDVIVVGAGIGGSTLGYALARRGQRVLFVEKGRFHHGSDDLGDGVHDPDELQTPGSRLTHGFWPTQLQGQTSFGPIEFYAPLGCGTGGTSALFAAQLERMAPIDFEPKSTFGYVEDANVADAWPIAYEALVPYYRRAERLYRVTGTPDPLNPDPEACLREPPPLSARDQALFDVFERVGLHPYRAHAGFEFVEGCEECGAAICPRECKSDAGRVCLMPALREHGAKILPECEVESLVADRHRVIALNCRQGERALRLEGKRIVLAAGAYMTPVLLLNSRSRDWPDGLANSSGMVGRNLMLHCADTMALAPGGSLAGEGPKKSLSFNDFYVRNGYKLGAFQSVGIPVNYGWVLTYLRSVAQKDPRAWRKLLNPSLRLVARTAARYFKHASTFATVCEDLPYLDNRVIPDPDANNGMRFEYTYTDDLRRRNAFYREEIQQLLKGHCRVQVLTPENNINYGHVCGTCRFGADPASSVLDPNNRAHELDNLWVVDASFFPSSSGTNPSLTIAANALRVADTMG